MTLSTILDQAARQLIHTIPAGLPAGSTPPAGVALAVRAPGFDQTAHAGFRALPTSQTDTAPLGLDTQHDLASVTKVVATTTALLRLVSDRLLKLDDPAHRYLPRFCDGRKNEITVRQLLQHRAGLWEWQPLYLAADTVDAGFEFVDRHPLRYAPGTARHYSDFGFIQLGRIIGSVTGLPLPDAIGALVTGPLGLRSTQFARSLSDDVATSSLGDQAEFVMVDTGTPYPVPYKSGDFSGWRRTPLRGVVNDGNAFHVFDGVSGHAGLFSTLPDLMTFADAFAHYGDHEQLWRPEVAEEFFAAGPDAEQALGFRRSQLKVGGRQLDLLWHPGFVGCVVGFVPGHGVSLGLASNRLVTPGIPIPTDSLWERLRGAATAVLDETLGSTHSAART
ncbi:serine hydrolase domain-containing protein [Cryobacterium aureum]|uniref:serine hydrolase domain-containing protein n=1 Tax=Cryobacterium aureum TaxID=995037 RepID=UPI000CF3DDE6|nr:serine hydrolase domain-containing protein [Cryobacterium aureum]